MCCCCTFKLNLNEYILIIMKYNHRLLFYKLSVNENIINLLTWFNQFIINNNAISELIKYDNNNIINNDNKVMLMN